MGNSSPPRGRPAREDFLVGIPDRLPSRPVERTRRRGRLPHDGYPPGLRAAAGKRTQNTTATTRYVTDVERSRPAKPNRRTKRALRPRLSAALRTPIPGMIRLF